MPSIQMILTGLSVTKGQEQELTLNAIDLLAAIEGGSSEGIIVSIQRAQSVVEVRQEIQSATVEIQIYVSNTTSTLERTRMIWSTIDMARRILGKNPDATYQAVIEKPPTNTNSDFTLHSASQRHFVHLAQNVPPFTGRTTSWSS